jgi:hypothetical protein
MTTPRARWFAFNQHPDWTGLIALTAVVLAFLSMLPRLAAALLAR